MGVQTETVRLFSAQSSVVFHQALAGLYRAKASLAREPWDYGAERALLHGVDPIWGFIPRSWELEDYIDGEILEQFRCEMSLPQKDSWNPFVILELVLPSAHVKRGVTHNASASVVVFPYITNQNIIAAYKISDSVRPVCLEGLVPRYYFKSVKSIYRNTDDGDALFKERIDFAQEFVKREHLV